MAMASLSTRQTAPLCRHLPLLQEVFSVRAGPAARCKFLPKTEAPAYVLRSPVHLTLRPTQGQSGLLRATSQIREQRFAQRWSERKIA